MAVTYGFYNALNHDRLYDAIQMSSIFDGIIRDGIFSTIGDTMIVTAPEDGLYVNVGSGRAWFNHTWTLNDTDYPIEAEEAEVVLDRIDAVILEVNSSAEVRANSIKFLKGTPSSNPVKPTLTHNAEVNQYALAYVRIRAGQTTIFQSDIENAVGTDETPFITGVLQQVSIETLLKQWEAEFNTYFTNFQNTSTTEFNNWFAAKVSEYTAWFAQMQTDMDSNFNEFDAWFQRMKDQLDQDQAGHLQLQIDNLSGRIDDIDAEMPFAGGSKVNINFEYDVKPNIQYSNEHYKLTVGDTVRENNFSSSKLHFDEYGILTVGDGVLEVTYDVTDSRTGKVTPASYTYTINMPYFGRFAYNVTISASLYNYQGWLESIGKDASQYVTIDDVFADEKLLRELMTRHASVDYLVEWLADNNEDAHTVLNNDYCAKWINLRDYALDKLYANTTVKAVMDEVDKYGYGEWALVGQVPKMTSNTAPYGEASAIAYDTNSEPYRAFDGNFSEGWNAQNKRPNWIQYKFVEKKIINGLLFKLAENNPNRIKTWTLQGSNDGSVFVDITSGTGEDNNKVITFDNSTSYQYYRLYNTVDSPNNTAILGLQFYAWQPKGNVPVMTSNTAPYGEASADTIYGSGYEAFRAFDDSETSNWSASNNGSAGLNFKFTNPVNIKRFKIRSYNATTWELYYSNDGSNWTSTNAKITVSIAGSILYADVNTDIYALYWRVKATTTSSAIYTLQFYGRELKVSVPKMTSNTAPWGEASMHADQGSPNSSYPAWKAFDKIPNLAIWNGNEKNGSGTINDNAYIRYRFSNHIAPRMFGFRWGDENGSNYIFTVKVQGSNDGILWEDLSSDIEQSMTTNMKYYALSNANNAYKYIQLLYIAYNVQTNRACPQASEIQFYGLDYSEREFEEGSTMKYLYDHGIKLEELTLSDTSYESSEEIVVKGRGKVGTKYVSTSQKINLTPYNIERMVSPQNNGGILSIGANSNLPPTGGWTAYRDSTTDDLPYNSYLDITSINEERYLQLGSGGTDTYMFSVTEWWLE